jgi:hypothetical protein
MQQNLSRTFTTFVCEDHSADWGQLRGTVSDKPSQPAAD